MKQILLALTVTTAVLSGDTLSDSRPHAGGLELDGLIQPDRIVEVSGPVDGLIEEILVEVGDPVHEGEVIARLESSVERARYEFALERSRQTARIQSSETRLRQAQRRLSKQQSLHERGIISPEALDEARTEKELAEHALLEAREQRRLAARDLESAEAALRLRTIRSTITGLVVERYVQPGELVTRNESRILRMAQIDPLRVEVIAPLKHLRRIETGMQARVLPEPPVGGEYVAEVVVVDPIIDAASSTFGVELELPNPGGALPAGLRCRVVFPPPSP